MEYPWYDLVTGDVLEQGHLLESCAVFLPPEGLASNPTIETVFRWEQRDVIVLSQTCDLAKGREKVLDVLLCAVWKRSQLNEGYLATAKGMEEARRGNLPSFHVLAGCEIPSLTREIRVVDFRRVFSLPMSFVRNHASSATARLRLLPPYREHLAQAFARFIMRVGLPVDVPAFK